MRKLLYAVTVLTILLCIAGDAGTASAETAEDITAEAAFASIPESSDPRNLLDGRYTTCWASKYGYLEVRLPDSRSCCGVSLCFKGPSTACVLQIPDGNGGWKDYSSVDGGGFAHQYHALPGVGSFRIRASEDPSILTLSEMRIYGPGELPDTVQQWESPEGKADLMLIATHPDDEFLWFGGTLPTYAGERGKQVQVVTMSCMTPFRQSELLDALWTGGVRRYPVIGKFEDRRAETTDKAFRVWGGKSKIVAWLVDVLREFRPEVVLTQDRHGEYGHTAHIVTVSSVLKAVESAADPEYGKDGSPDPWQVRKLYLHLATENAIVMDWDIPLESFGGRTSFEVAQEAMTKHRSQEPQPNPMSQKGKYDCRKFGLVFSTVGEDTAKNDFMENID